MVEAGELTLQGRIDTSGMQDDLDNFQNQIAGGGGFELPFVGNIGTFGAIAGILGGVVGMLSQVEDIRSAFTHQGESPVGEALIKPSEQIDEIRQVQRDIMKAEQGVFAQERRQSMEALNQLTSKEGQESFSNMVKAGMVFDELWNDIKQSVSPGEAEGINQGESRPARLGSAIASQLPLVGDRNMQGLGLLGSFLASLFSNSNETDQNLSSVEEQGVIGAIVNGIF